MGSDQSSSSDEEESEAEEGADLDGEEVLIGTGPDVADDIELDPSEWGIGAAAGRPDADTTLVAMEDETRRLAAVDLDWSRMRAVDVFAVLQSFVGKQGQLKEVTVYLSDYGKQEMAHEKEHGPRGLQTGEVCLLAQAPVQVFVFLIVLPVDYDVFPGQLFADAREDAFLRARNA